jgi:uncharacterized protein (UPF0276 family)
LFIFQEVTHFNIIMVGKMFGLGLRQPHHNYVLKNKPKVDFLEVHTENFIAEGGASLDFLEKISELYKLSFHCVGISFGSSNGLDAQHLQNIKNLLDTFKPFLFSDHLSWSNSPSQGISNDLLPISYTQKSLDNFCQNVNQAQDYFGRNILIENPSAYLEYHESDISEVDFINELANKTDCDILLDINNVYVSSQNFNFCATEYLKQIDHTKVKEIHLAGHSIYDFQGQNIRIDTHNTHICDEVLELYQNFIKTTNLQVPTLVEWDDDIPEFEVLYNELEKVKSLT